MNLPDRITSALAEVTSRRIIFRFVESAFSAIIYIIDLCSWEYYAVWKIHSYWL